MGIIPPMLPHPNDKHLKAAQGWLELGDHVEAFVCIEEIEPTFKRHPEVLKLQWGIFAKTQQWGLCAEVAKIISHQCPWDSWGYLHHAVALRQSGQISKAVVVLEGVVENFPKEWSISFFLAGYLAQLGRIGEAEIYFDGAIDLGGKKARLMALESEDFEPLRQGRI